jgi:hypothetical protein
VFICVHLWFQRLSLASLLLFALAPTANAYCIYNQLKDKDVAVEQEPHPDDLRNDRRMRVTIPPGGKQCCEFHQLDCNPLGRENSTVRLGITVAGEPAYQCGLPDPKDWYVKVTGAGTIRVEPNPRKSANPFITRVYTHEGKDMTGPAGLACVEVKPKPPEPKADPKQKGK